MKYWLFQNNQVTGPYDREQIGQIKGFSAESLVCPEGRKGTEMGDWQRAGMVQELAETLLRGAKVTAAASGGSVGLLPPEPTLKDLAVMGTLQEKTQLLENALNQIQEELRAREVEINGLKDSLRDRENAAAEMRTKLSEMEARLIDVGNTASKVSGLAHIEEDVATLKHIIESQSETIQTLQSKLDKPPEAVNPADVKVKEPFPVINFQAEAAAALSTPLELEPSRAAVPEEKIEVAEAAKHAVGEAPAPSAKSAEPEIAAAPKAETAMPEINLTPVPAPLLSETLKIEPIKLAPVEPALGQEKPPMTMEAKKKSSGPMMGRIAEQEGAPPAGEPAKTSAPAPAQAKDLPKVEELLMSPLEMKATPKPLEASKASPLKVEKPGIKKPEMIISAKSKKGGNRFLIVAVGCALAVTVVTYAFLGRNSKRRKPVQAPVAPVANLESPASIPMPPAAQPPTSENAANPTGGPINQPAQASADGLVGQDPTQVAIEFAKAYKIPNSDATLAGRLETAYPSTGGLSPWMVEPLGDDKYQVNFYAPGTKAPSKDGKSKLLVYEFVVHPKAQTLVGQNPPAQSLLKGEAPVPPELAKPARKQSAAAAIAPKKKRLGRRTKVIKHLPAAAKNEGSTKIDESVFPTKKEGDVGQANLDGDVSLDQLLLPGVPKQETPKKGGKKRKPAAGAEDSSSPTEDVPSDAKQ